MNTKYEILYEYEFINSKIIDILPLFGITAFAIIITFLYKRNAKSINSTINQILLSFLYIFIIFSSIISIISISKIPGIISNEKQLKEVLKSKNYSIIEGKINNYKLDEVNGQYFESFSINDVRFKYSDDLIFYGYHQTSKNGGLIKENGQYIRISYIVLNQENLILRIEKPTSNFP